MDSGSSIIAGKGWQLGVVGDFSTQIHTKHGNGGPCLRSYCKPIVGVSTIWLYVNFCHFFCQNLSIIYIPPFLC